MVVMLFRKETYTHVMTSVEILDGTKWTDPGFPEPLTLRGLRAAVRLSGGGPQIRRSPLRTHWRNSRRTVSRQGWILPEVKKVVLVQGVRFQAYSLWNDGRVSEVVGYSAARESRSGSMHSMQRWASEKSASWAADRLGAKLRR